MGRLEGSEGKKNNNKKNNSVLLIPDNFIKLTFEGKTADFINGSFT